MPIKLFKPTTPGRRFASSAVTKDLTNKRPEKNLVYFQKRTGGRNNQGKITVRHRGGGARRFIRMVDFRRDKFDIPARVEALEYDPARGARLALLLYRDGERRYIIAPQDVTVGQVLLSSKERVEVKPGNRMPLGRIPVGQLIHSIELVPDQGGKLVRGAGLSAQLMAVEAGYAQVKFPSGEVRRISGQCLATIGAVGNPDHRLIRLGKAGRMRHKGIRPTVRGKVMNPVDHPHGGGEGKHPIGMKYAKTKWGKHALGVKTRRAKKWSNKLIVKRRKAN